MRFHLILTFLSGALYGVHCLKQCDNDSTFKEPASGTCKGYWDCNQGILKFSKCSYLHSFDSQKLECVWNPLQSNDVPCGKDHGFNATAEWCKEGRFFKAPVNGLCDSYYDCQNGNMDIKACVWPTQFNPQEQECLPNVWPVKFSCWQKDDQKPSTTEQPENITSITTVSPDENSNSNHQDAKPQCTKGRTFVAVNAQDCTKYYSCDDGVLTSKNCGYFEKFDAARLECRWFNVECSTTSQIPNVPVTTVQPMSTTHKPTSKTSTPKTDTPLKLVCLESNYYAAVYPNDCQKYYLCSKGKITVNECSTLQKFDPLTHECRYDFHMFSYKVNCSAKPEAPVCKKGYFFKTAYPGKSNKYYDCLNGTMTIENCGSVHSFVETSQTCVFSIFGFNIDETKYVDEWISQAQHLFDSQPHQNSVTSEETRNIELEINPSSLSTSSNNVVYSNVQRCVMNSSFKFPYQGDCHKYHRCSNGSLRTLECQYGYKFNNRTQNCTPMTQCDLTTCYSKGPLCYPGITYRIPHSGDCHKYAECLDGIWKTKSCSQFHQFNPSTQNCELAIFSNIDCSTPIKCNRTFLELSLIKKDLPRVDKLEELIDFKSSDWPKCDPGQNFRTTFPYDCGKYLSCSNGNMTVKSCFIFDKFDPKTLECRFNSPWDPVVCGTKPGKPQCGADQNYKAVFPYDCAKYYDCSNGNLTVKSCSMFDKFDPKILDCRFKMNPFQPINCDSPPGEPTCSKGKTFNSVYPDNCSKYYKCNDGVVSQEKCALWKLFDPATLQCRWNIPFIDSVNCSAIPGSELVGRIKIRDTTNNLARINATGKDKDLTESVVQPECAANQNFQTVYPNECKKYFNCDNGTETVEECSWLRKFNPANFKCRWDFPFYRVNCSASPGSDLPVYPTKLKDSCKSGRTFKAVDKSDCGSYYSCSDGKLSYESCGMLKKFDPAGLSCLVDLPFHRVNCSALPGEPNCPKTGIMRKPYPGDCSKYYECHNGTLNVELCGLWEKFDHDTLMCRYSLLPVNCGY